MLIFPGLGVLGLNHCSEYSSRCDSAPTSSLPSWQEKESRHLGKIWRDAANYTGKAEEVGRVQGKYLPGNL